MSRVLVISDTQAPFQHPDTIRFLKAVKRKYNPNQVVHIGDLVDFHAASDYTSDPDGYSAGHELSHTENFVKELSRVFPKMTVVLGNHDTRIQKKALKAGIPARALVDYRTLLKAPKSWNFVTKTIIDEVIYVHGDAVASSGGNRMQNAIKKYMRSVVFGHWHTIFGIDYHANEDALLFGMCVGCLIDHKTYAFEYQRLSPRKPIVGVGVVENGSPKLIPMILDEEGRWVGKL